MFKESADMMVQSMHASEQIVKLSKEDGSLVMADMKYRQEDLSKEKEEQ